MSDQTMRVALAPGAEAEAPLEPTAAGKTPMGRLLTGVLPATVAMYALYQGIQQVLIPLQVQQIDPKQKVANLAIITAISAVTSLIALPIGGAVSDWTRGRFGRRTPWLLASGMTSAILVVVMGTLNLLWPLAVVYAALWFAANFYQGVWAAILPDRVPVARRGLASSVLGIGTPLGILLGVNYVAQVSHEAAYISLGAFLVAATLFLVFIAPEGAYNEPRPVRQRRSLLKRVGEFFGGFSHVNFRYAFASRFLLYLAYFVINGYLLYTLQDRVGVQNVPGHSAAVGIGILVTVNTVAWIGSAALAGWLADVFKRRKMFVGIAAVGMGLASLIPVFFPTWTAMVVFSLLVGVFKGSYLAVDFALMSLVLPDKDSEGRDMGLLSVATGAPQLISGAVAGLLITFAGGYVALFVFGTIVAFLAGLAVIPIRNIR